MIIAPSILAIQMNDFSQQMDELNQSSAEWIHMDIMDGHFVPNLSYGPHVVKGLRSSSNKFFDVHLMVSDPIFYAKAFIEAGADAITFHVEALKKEEIEPFIDTLHKQGVKVGISIKPKTPVSAIEAYLDKVDIVLVMSVEPGFGGQSFMPSALDKIDQLSKHNGKFEIEVDGGINPETARLCKEKGATVLVAGSYVFKGNIEERVQSLR
ncbi:MULTISPECIES: ribulose-phosphate 3-epimerase [Terrabacteria group]|uniref:ribulose-phosphate 3-epimerase n=1 Tax=Bacillati TaxID=1783272 RepID=UPI00193AA5E9|nr:MULTISPECIES: ribulose-phosphate 3-epimerase [Terrabacteria group]MBW9212370.1 ribulose-phosphate 3-epimerase [Trueperella sp. zg.1013]QRG86097.1 ribulose-phosphate 3-epimerase [Bulleidia sp. zg-1006]